MSKCLEAYKKHMQNPQHRCHYHEWQAAWNARGKVDAEICNAAADKWRSEFDPEMEAGANYCAEAIEQENEK